MSRRVTVADRLDAGGITDVGERTGSVVEQLLAAPPTADSALVEIPTERIHNHPRNRRVLDEDVADIVAGLKAGEPILNPLGVTAAADWNAGKPDDLAEIPPGDYMVTAGGHRRLRAAELAGLKTVPCIVRATFAGGAGRRAALLENVQRKDLDVFEQAEAIAELVAEPYKMSQRDVATLLGVNQSHVSKRLKLLKLPSTVRESVRLGKLPIPDALELAGVVEHKAVFDLALEKVRQWRYDGKRAVQAAQGEYDAQKRYEAESAKLTEAGVTVVDRWPSYSGSTSSREPVRLDGLGITTAKHKKEPCHGAHVQTSGHQEKAQITWCCTDPRRHAAKGASKVKSTKKSSTNTSDAEKEIKRRRTELRKTVNPARLAIVRQLYAGGGFDADTRRELIGQSVIRRLLSGGYSAPSTEVAVDLLDIRPANERAYLAGVLIEHAKTVKPDALALAGALVHFETRLHENRYSWDADDRWYLELLARNGYVVTDTEHAMLGDEQVEDGTWQPRAVDDGEDDPKCRICMQYLDSLPFGVTAVAEDLCSGCSDATAAGWLADESAPVVAAPSTTACMECEHVEPDVGCACEYCYCGTAAADVDQDHEQLLEASAAVG